MLRHIFSEKRGGNYSPLRFTQALFSKERHCSSLFDLSAKRIFHFEIASAAQKTDFFRQMNPQENPTPWQNKTLWRAITALSIAVVFSVAIGFVYVFSQVMAFLQPILVPFAIAGVLAYLLEPLVAWLVTKGTTRPRAVATVFVVNSLVLAGLLFWMLPVISRQTSRLAQNVPAITIKVREGVYAFAEKAHAQTGFKVLPDEFLEALKYIPKPPAQTPAELPKKVTPAPPETKIVELAPTEQKDAPTTTIVAIEPAPPAGKLVAEEPQEILKKIGTGEWADKALPNAINKVWAFLSSSLGGFLGFFGFILSLIIVPLYLFYFLTESPHIAKGWSKYLPLRASHFKDEVVASITEINGYLIAFFRGQLIVSLINGTVTGIALAAAGLEFGILVGFALCFLGIIPYIGIILCWIPAVIIASVQGGSWLVHANAAWWVFPVVVTGIFTVVQQVDGLFVTPKIVGERVGLHPVTVIFSVFLWSLLLGGLLGAILAVPLTATAKVILKRYIWERTIMAEIPPTFGDSTISDK